MTFNEWQAFLQRQRERAYLKQLGRPVPDHLKDEDDLTDIERD